MSIVKVNSENFQEEVIKSDKKVLIDFYADWCGPCKMISPVIESIADENQDIKVAKVDVDAQGDLASKYGVMSIPTLLVIENGEEINRSVGLISKAEILSLVK